MSTPKTRTKARRHPSATATAIIGEDVNVMDERGAARYLGVSADVLRLWRSRSSNESPIFFRAGQKLIRYRKIDLDRWIDARLSRQEGQKLDLDYAHGGDDVR